MSADLCEIANEFFLGIYRNAVELYQPLIEKRTGIRLGSIRVRDYRLLESDQILALKQVKHPWWYRLLGCSAIEKEYREYCRQLEKSRDKRSRPCMASYYRKTIYVNFLNNTLCHQEDLAFTTVHELAHALWEAIAGQSLDQMWPDDGPEREQFRLFVEGHATYAEQVWFKDFYPASVPAQVDGRKEDGSVYARGRDRIAALVDQFGSEILMVIPKRWSDFCE